MRGRLGFLRQLVTVVSQSALVICTTGVACAAPSPATPPLPAERLKVQRQLYLMGTWATLAAYATDRESGLQQLEHFIRILENTEQELSTWRPDSVLSRMNRGPAGTPFTLNPALCRLFEDLFFWHGETRSAFDPAIGSLIQAWKVHQAGNLPAAEVLGAARELAGMRYLNFEPSVCQIVRRRETTVDAGAFGKGEALDRVLRYALQNNSSPWLIDLGGQVMAHGRPPEAADWRIDLAHPVERNRPLLAIRLSSGSVSTSGGSEKDLWVEGRRVGHILDPRTGRPAPTRGSVAVWHPSALVADILSTALYVMGPEEGLAWAEARRLAVCFLIAWDGKAHSPAVTARASSAFARRFF